VTSPGQKRETTKSGDRKEDSEGQIKRWEAQDGPFRGFNSPPGRF
jgi:hypothetical protein